MRYLTFLAFFMASFSRFLDNSDKSVSIDIKEFSSFSARRCHQHGGGGGFLA